MFVIGMIICGAAGGLAGYHYGWGATGCVALAQIGMMLVARGD